MNDLDIVVKVPFETKKYKLMKTEFHPMQEIPEQATDLKGVLEDFSVPVLVYSEDDPTYCEIGHYNFDTKTWDHLGGVSIRLICWCYIPDATTFTKENKLTHILHDGYRETVND